MLYLLHGHSLVLNIRTKKKKKTALNEVPSHSESGFSNDESSCLPHTTALTKPLELTWLSSLTCIFFFHIQSNGKCVPAMLTIIEIVPKLQ